MFRLELSFAIVHQTATNAALLWQKESVHALVSHSGTQRTNSHPNKMVTSRSNAHQTALPDKTQSDEH